MKKRWLAVLLTMAMCLSLLPNLAMAAEEEAKLYFYPMKESDEGTYAVTDSHLDVVSLSFGEELFGVFYYGTETAMEPVSEDDLDPSNPVRISSMNPSMLADDALEGYAVEFALRGTGEDYCVEYEDAKLEVLPQLPEVGLYKAAERSLENYLYGLTKQNT